MKIFGPGMMRGVNAGLADRERYQQTELTNQRQAEIMEMRQAQDARQQQILEMRQAEVARMQQERQGNRVLAMNPQMMGDVQRYMGGAGPRANINPMAQQAQFASPEMMNTMRDYRSPEQTTAAGLNAFRQQEEIKAQYRKPEKTLQEIQSEAEAKSKGKRLGDPRDKSPKTQVTVKNMGNVKEKKFNEGVGGNFAKSFSGYIEQEKAANRDYAKYKILGQYLQDAGSGILRGKTLKLQQLADSIGLPVDVKSLDAAQAVKVISNQMALALRSPAAGMGMPGQMSDKDREFLMESVPGLLNSPGAAQKIVGYYLKLVDRRKKVGRLAQKWYLDHEKTFDEAEFNQYLRIWTEENPLFPETNTTDADAEAQALINEVIGE